MRGEGIRRMASNFLKKLNPFRRKPKKEVYHVPYFEEDHRPASKHRTPNESNERRHRRKIKERNRRNRKLRRESLRRER